MVKSGAEIVSLHMKDLVIVNKYAVVAEWMRHLPSKETYVGSSPTGSANDWGLSLIQLVDGRNVDQCSLVAMRLGVKRPLTQGNNGFESHRLHQKFK